MSFNEILTNICIALGIGSILALIIRFCKEEIPLTMYVYSFFVLVMNIVIYPILFPLVFNKKEFSEYAADKMIKDLKDRGLSTKNISKKKIKKKIYNSLTPKMIYILWGRTIYFTIRNITKRFDTGILFIKKSDEYQKYIKKKCNKKLKSTPIFELNIVTFKILINSILWSMNILTEVTDVSKDILFNLQTKLQDESNAIKC